MTRRVEGKVALITGAARGQGRAHAIRLAEEGADIIAIDICAPIAHVQYPAATPEDLTETKRLVGALDSRIVSYVIDTRDIEKMKLAVDEAVADLGRLDIVVANAGICIVGAWDQVTPEVFRDTVDINLVGTWNTLKVTVPHLVNGGGGSVIVTSSAAGLKALPFQTSYVASKFGVTGLARAFAMELAQHKIRVNCIHPTGVRTAMGEGQLRANIEAAVAGNSRLAGMYTNALDIDVTEPEDQANAVLFLASDEARYITGLSMTVDAGMTQY